MRFSRLPVLLSFPLLSAVACGHSGTAPPTVCTSHPSTANFPDGKLLSREAIVAGSIRISPQGDRVALVSRKPGTIQIDFHDRTCRVAELPYAMEFSEDGEVAWFFHEHAGQRLITVNGITREIQTLPGRGAMILSRQGGWAFRDVRIEERFAPHLLSGGRYGLDFNPGFYLPKDNQYLHHAGGTVGPHDGINAVAFSADGARFGYRSDDGTDSTFVVDGKKFPADEFFFSEDYRHQARRLRQGGKAYLDLEGVRYGGYEEILDARWSPRGDAWFKYRKGKLEYLHLSGRDHGGYEKINPPLWDAFGRAIIQYQQGAKWFVSHAGAMWGPSDDSFGIQFSPNQEHVAVVLDKDKTEVIAIGGKQWACDDVSDPQVSNTGRIACLCWRGRTLFFRRDETLTPIGEKDAVWSYGFPAASEGGDHYGYLAWERHKGVQRAYAFVDGQRFGPYGSVGKLRFSPDGDHFSFECDSGLNVDGVDTEPNRPAGKFTATVDWSTVAYRMVRTRGTSAEAIVRVNGKDYPGHDDWSPRLSPDQRQLAFSYRVKNGWMVVYDHHPVGVFPWAQILFTADGKPILIYLKDNAIWRQAIPVKP